MLFPSMFVLTRLCEQAEAAAVERKLNEGPTAEEDPSLLGLLSSVPRIIYASRTHSQIKHVIEELRRTPYHPQMCVLGSRDQLCIHEEASKLHGATLNSRCRALVSSQSCRYYRNAKCTCMHVRTSCCLLLASLLRSLFPFLTRCLGQPHCSGRECEWYCA